MTRRPANLETLKRIMEHGYGHVAVDINIGSFPITDIFDCYAPQHIAGSDNTEKWVCGAIDFDTEWPMCDNSLLSDNTELRVYQVPVIVDITDALRQGDTREPWGLEIIRYHDRKLLKLFVRVEDSNTIEYFGAKTTLQQQEQMVKLVQQKRFIVCLLQKQFRLPTHAHTPKEWINKYVVRYVQHIEK